MSNRRHARLPTWVSPEVAVALLIAAVLMLGAAVSLRAPQTAGAATGVQGSVSYLLGAENPDGGFGPAPGQPSAGLYTGWAVLGLASAGTDLARVRRGSGTVLAYLRAGAGSLSDAGSLERTILVVRAAGLSARSFGGHDLLAALQRRVRSNGSVLSQVNLTAFAVLALRAAGVAPKARTVAWLERQQDADGGFNFSSAGGSSDVDDTGAVLEALAGENGRAAGVRARAVTYLRRQQNRDGGFASQGGAASNAQSTAWAIQGLDAGRVSLASFHHRGSPSPLSFLRSLIAPDGAIRYARGVRQTPVWVTAEALMALAGKPLPLAPAVNPTAPLVTPNPGASARPRVAATTSTGEAATTATGTTRSGRSPAASSVRRSGRATPRSVRPGDRVTRAGAGGAVMSGPLAGLVRGAGLATALALAPLGLG